MIAAKCVQCSGPLPPPKPRGRRLYCDRCASKRHLEASARYDVSRREKLTPELQAELRRQLTDPRP